MSEHIDKIFRDKLGKHQAPVPEDLWKTIAADQATKLSNERWRAVSKYAVLLVLRLGGLAFTVYLITNVGQPTSDTEPAVATTTTPKLNAGDAKPATAAEVVVNEPTEYQLEPNGQASADDRSAKPSLPLASSLATVQDNQAGAFAIRENEKIISTSNRDIGLSSDVQAEQITQQTEQRATISRVPTLPLPLLSPYRAVLEKPAVRLADQPQATGTFRKQLRDKFTFDLVAGPAYANQIFSLSDESNRELLNAREISEFPSVSLLAGFRVAYQLKGRWSLRTGLLFTQIRNQFEYEQMPDDPTETPLLIRSSNRIRLLELPLLATYQLPGKRFRLAVNAGPVLNLSTTAKGRHLLSDLQQPIDLEESNIYRSRVGISYQISLTAAYQLGRGNSLLIEPTFRSYRSSFTQDAYALDERYWLAGIQFGLRHALR